MEARLGIDRGKKVDGEYGQVSGDDRVREEENQPKAAPTALEIRGQKVQAEKSEEEVPIARGIGQKAGSDETPDLAVGKPLEVAIERVEDSASNLGNPSEQNRVGDAERENDDQHGPESSTGLRKRECHRLIAVHLRKIVVACARLRHRRLIDLLR
jgi:hypothetical protein